MVNEFDIKLRRNIKLSCIETGDPKGYPILYLHGTPGSKKEAIYLEDSAEKHNIRLIAFDRPGFGRSEFYQYTPKTLSKDIDEIIGTLDIEKYSIVGYSAGAMYMFQHTLETQNKPEALFDIAGWMPVALDKDLYNCLSAFDKVAIGKVKDTPKLTTIPEFLLKKAFSLKEDDLSLANLLDKFSRLMGKSFAFGDDDFSSFFASNVRYALGETMEGANHALKQLFELPKYNPADIELPYISWHGSDDDYVPFGFVEYKKKNISNFKLNTLEGEGHFQPLTHKFEIFRQIKDLLTI